MNIRFANSHSDKNCLRAWLTPSTLDVGTEIHVGLALSVYYIFELYNGCN
jgi:hypothetical protein